MCDKVPYDTRGDAARQIPSFNKKKRAKKHKYTVYSCPDCGKFHITTVTKSLKPQKDKYKHRYRNQQRVTAQIRVRKKKRNVG